jgi:hypothetical protein
MDTDEKITIIEGPPPTFEAIDDGWALGLNEGPYLAEIALTRLRTFNGASLVERCYRAWHKNQNIQLEYRSPEGLEETAPIVAARSLETVDGQVLLLWVRLPGSEVELELGYDDASDDADDDDDLGLDEI